MNNYHGVIIEESLAKKYVLKKVRVVSTKIEQVMEGHQTPWILQWTLHTVEIPENNAHSIAEEVSRILDPNHEWYADFKNDTHHYIIFRNKVFFVDRASHAEYDAAKQHGLSLGIPEYQVDFHPEVKQWKR